MVNEWIYWGAIALSFIYWDEGGPALLATYYFMNN